MLQIRCDKCGHTVWVHGHTTPDSFEEPGEVVTDLRLVYPKDTKLCEHLENGEECEIMNEAYEDHDY